MIYISAQTVTGAAKQGFLAALDCPPNPSDPTILHENAAVIEVTDPGASPIGFVIENNTFAYQLDYRQYVPEIDASLVAAEETDYSQLFLEPGHINTIISCIKQYPDSRRNVINSWSPVYLDPEKVGVCITQLYFRVRDGYLELHSHARANDAYRLLLLDMQLATSIQREVARAVGITVGTYVHFVDSLHCYKDYAEQIQRQRDHVTTNSIWQT